MTLEALALLHLDHLRGLRRSPRTLTSLQLIYKDFRVHCQQLGLEDPRELLPQHLDSYVASLRGRSLTPLSVYYRQSQVKTWLRWATLRSHILIDPGRDHHMRFPHHLPRGAPTEEQMARLLDVPSTDTVFGRRDRALMALLYGTGLRVAECSDLDLSDLDLECETLHVRHGKGDKARALPLTPNLLQAMRAYLGQTRPHLLGSKSCPALWLTRQGTRLRPFMVRCIVKSSCRTIGLENISVHSLRHAFATHLLARGANLTTVQALLGHSDLQMVMRYTHLLAQDVETELLRTHPRARRCSSRPSKNPVS